MKLTGAHAIIYTKDADADRAFLRDVLKLSHVDTGGGWLIFSLPPAELGCIPRSATTSTSFTCCATTSRRSSPR